MPLQLGPTTDGMLSPSKMDLDALGFLSLMWAREPANEKPCSAVLKARSQRLRPILLGVGNGW